MKSIILTNIHKDTNFHKYPSSASNESPETVSSKDKPSKEPSFIYRFYQPLPAKSIATVSFPSLEQTRDTERLIAIANRLKEEKEERKGRKKKERKEERDGAEAKLEEERCWRDEERRDVDKK